jgi:hypothetical protein
MHCAHRDCPHKLVAGSIYCGLHLAIGHKHRSNGNWPPHHPAHSYVDDKGMDIARENGARAAAAGRPRASSYDDVPILAVFNAAWLQGYDAAAGHRDAAA